MTDRLRLAVNCVVVERLPFGSSSFSCSTADCSHDVLTVSCTDAEFDRQHGPMHVYEPHEWAHATVYDEQGNVLASFASDAGQQQAADWMAKVRTSHENRRRSA